MKHVNQERAQSEPRRKLIKLMAVGGTGLSAAVLPERWTRPVVNSVLLPAHAATTDEAASGTRGEVPESCQHDSVTIVDAGEIGSDDIMIIYDGATTCDIVTGDVAEGDATPADAVIVIDSDPDDSAPTHLTWDYSGTGSNWTMVGQSFDPADDDDADNPQGDHYIEVVRVSDPTAKFRVYFTVQLVGDPGNVDFTVKNINIVAI